jgi:hypothetical protein
MTEVTFHKSNIGVPPSEITSITLMQEQVPSIGEEVVLFVQITKKDHCRIEGLVKTVTWHIDGKNTYAHVLVL